MRKKNPYLISELCYSLFILSFSHCLVELKFVFELGRIFSRTFLSSLIPAWAASVSCAILTLSLPLSFVYSCSLSPFNTSKSFKSHSSALSLPLSCPYDSIRRLWSGNIFLSGTVFGYLHRKDFSYENV